MTTRIRIDAVAGVVELEGEREFVEAQLERLLPLIETGGFATRAEVKHEPPDPTRDGATNGSGAETQSGKRGKPRKRTIPPKGHSCADRMMTLRNEGFFKNHQTAAQIVSELEKKGWTHQANQVAAAGTNMFNRGDIQRTKTGRSWEYYWDRD